MKCKLLFETKNVPTFEDFEKSIHQCEGCSIRMIIERACQIIPYSFIKGYLLTPADQCYKFEYYKDTARILTEAIGELKPKVPLTFETLRKANIARLPEFKNSKGEPAHSKEDGSDWSPAQWLQAVIGELGEYANVMKKVERGDLSFEEAKPLIEKELADVMTYLDILAFRVNVDLSKAVQEKFNEVSERVGCSLRIENNEVIRKPDVNKTYGFVLPTYSQAVDFAKLGSEELTKFSINNRKSYVSSTKEELQEELAKIKESNQAMLEKRLRTEYKSKAKEIADNWIGTNKISNDTRAKIEDLVEQDLLEIKKSIESESEKVSTIELIVNAALMGVKFSEATKLKVDKLIGEDLKQIKESGCGTSIFENYDYNTKNGELTPKQEFVSKLQTEQEFWNNNYKLSKQELFIKKSFSSDIGGVLNEMIRWKLFRNYAEIYPLKLPRNAIDNVFSFEFQGIDNGKQYLFYHVKQIFHARQNSSLQVRAVVKSYLFEFFSKQLGTKITGMLINGSREITKLNPGDLIQFHDDRNVLWNFRLVKSSDKNVEVSLS